MNRRVFLKSSAIAMAGIGSAPLWLERALYAAAEAPARRRKVLVAIFQRGAADGLNIVVPYGEAAYYRMRPTIAVPKPGSGEGSAIDLDGFFGLHPALESLKPIYDSGHLAIVHGAGSPDPTRSHFDAQDYMESGTPGVKSTDSGWMNRALNKETGAGAALQGIAIGPVLPRALRGENPATAVQDLASFQVRDAKMAEEFQKLYAESKDAVLSASGRQTFEAITILRKLQAQALAPSGAQYPAGRFADGLRLIAQLIKADVGLEMAFADIGGWDHHVNETGQRANEGQLANLLRIYGDSLAAFWRDLGDKVDDVVLVTMSEFGRTARENGNRGTDHGHANCMFVMGGPVRGGRVSGVWPGLEQDRLYEGRDLALTTDFRAVLGELIANHSGRDAGTIFPRAKNASLGLII